MSQKKKIGILTFWKSPNFGAFLQVFALQNRVNKLGYEAEIIGYDFEKRADLLKKKNLSFRRRMIRIYTQLNILRTGRKIRKAQKTLPISQKKYHSSEELASSISDWYKIIVGSDQVWNYQITKNDTTFLLDFTDENPKKISYAASFGVETLPVNYNGINLKDQYATYLEKFSKIGVRELSGKSIVDELIIGQAKVVVDPTLLLTKEEWQELSIKAIPEKENYLLIYSLDNCLAMYEATFKYAEKCGLNIVQIDTGRRKKYPKKINYIVVGPLEWISLFENASFVVTDSFHGTAFSINLNVDFAVFYHSEKNTYSRINDLLSLVSLLDRRFLENEEIPSSTIDFSKVENSLSIIRNDSLNYLSESLG